MARQTEKLDYTALRAELRDKGPGPLYMLWGPEDYLTGDFTARLRAACLAEGAEDFDGKRLDGPLPEPQALADALDAMPFFGGRTFVELRGFDVNRCRDERTASLLADIPEWCTVVVTLPAGMEPDGRLALVRQLKKTGRAVEFTAQEQSVLYHWLARRFAAHGRTAGRDVLDRLVFLSGDLMNRLIPEIDKVCAYAREETVTVSDVEAVAHHLPEADAFAMTECLSRRDFDGAARLLAELLAASREPIEILGTIGWQMRQLYGAKLAQTLGKGPAYAREVLGITNDYRLRRLTDTARGFTLPALTADVRLCAETDWRLKTSGGEGEDLLRELLVRFAMEECHA